MARPPKNHSNQEVKELLKTYSLYKELRTQEAKDILKKAITSSLPESMRKGLSVNDIFYILRTLDEINTETVGNIMNHRGMVLKKRTKPYSLSMIDYYRNAATKASKDLYQAYQKDPSILPELTGLNRSLSDSESRIVRSMITKRKSINDILRYLNNLED